LGGALGTGARYVLGGWLLRVLGPAFPFGTLAVNLVGCFLLGAVMQVALVTETLSPTLRLFLTVGVMGGFTTYSTFNYETLQYFEESAWLMGCLNLGVTIASCLVAGVLGVLSGRLLADGWG
jgi:CrcB protein